MTRPRSRSDRPRTSTQLDLERFRSALRWLDHAALLTLLDRALERVPRKHLAEIAEGCLSLEEPRPATALVIDVRNFHEASHRGDYYESFGVNSKNFMQKSPGTQRWIAECKRLFERCVTEAAKTPPADLREALGLLMALLRSVDEGNDDIVFWADEGGSWAVSIDWGKVLPVWFQALAATTPPEEYAREALTAIKDFDSFDRDRHLQQARTAASPAQREALQEAARQH
ncbi:hypothetical protein [Archangium sp.]|uniref:hypothetical protein n=1 Tax=Archangium sp. TaxID=1872627 RepID=UPI002D266AA9|nr:hypothetical protein [Archangium sp.]HYO57918.1 hypothetical protein [Archangium sp.]